MRNLSLEDIAKNKERLRQEIRQKEELLEAYALVEKDLQSKNGQSSPLSEPPITSTASLQVIRPTSYGYKTRVVCRAIDEIGKQFKIKDIQEYLTKNGIDISIESVTTVMNRLREGVFPKVRVKRPGKGRRSTIFEKA